MTNDMARTVTRLRAYEGATAELWSYSVSHRRLALRLEKDGKRADLVISPLESISGAASWKNAIFEVLAVGEKVVVKDRTANFEAIGGGISFLEGIA